MQQKKVVGKESRHMDSDQYISLHEGQEDGGREEGRWEERGKEEEKKERRADSYSPEAEDHHGQSCTFFLTSHFTLSSSVSPFPSPPFPFPPLPSLSLPSSSLLYSLSLLLSSHLSPSPQPRQSLVSNLWSSFRNWFWMCDPLLHKPFKFLHLNFNCSAKTNFLCNKDPNLSSSKQSRTSQQPVHTNSCHTLILCSILLEHKSSPQITYVIVESLLVWERE